MPGFWGPVQGYKSKTMNIIFSIPTTYLSINALVNWFILGEALVVDYFSLWLYLPPWERLQNIADILFYIGILEQRSIENSRHDFYYEGVYNSQFLMYEDSF